MKQKDEQREEWRLGANAAVFLEVESSGPKGEEATIILCRILDVSANGMRIRIDRPVPEGAILRLCADFGGLRPPLAVVGEVRWLKDEDDHHVVGFRLFESDYTDIAAWKQLVAEEM